MLPYLIASLVIGLTCVLLLRQSMRRRAALDPKSFQPFTLIQRTMVSPDTFIFRFALHHAEEVLGLPIGQHIQLRAECDSGEGKRELVTHAYTPISSDDDKGVVDFLVKVYLPNVHPKFPGGGRLSQHLYHLKLGDTVEMCGPLGKLQYKGNGVSKVTRPGKGAEAIRVDAFAMVAGGTGITPMLQIIRAIEKNPADKTKIFLVYGNQTEQDILLRSELDELCAKDPDRFHVWYTIDRDPSDTWKFDTGYVNEEMFRRHLPVPKKLGDGTVQQNEGVKKVMALMCGPPPMIQYAIKPNLEKLGYVADTMFSF